MEDKILLTLRILVAPIIYHNTQSQQLDENFKILRLFVMRMLRTEIFPSYSESPKNGLLFRITMRLEAGLAENWLERKNTLLSDFKDHVIPCLVRYYNTKQQLPEQMSFCMAALLHYYRKTLKFDRKLFQTQPILKLIHSLWKQDPRTLDGHIYVAATLLENEECWGQDLTEMPGLIELLARNLMALEYTSFEKNLEKSVKILS